MSAEKYQPSDTAAGTTTVGNPEESSVAAANGGAVAWQASPTWLQTKKRNEKKRLYKVWPSNNAFFCEGALIMGGEEECYLTPCCKCRWSCANCCNWCFILVPSVTYFLIGIPYCMKGFPLPLLVVTTVVFMITVSCLLLACCSDPGILPRRSAIIATECQEQLTAVLGYNPLGQGTPTHRRETDSTRMVPPELDKKGYRWCHTCEIVRPPRASHCPECDNCVLRFDHHCPFVNNCVGQRNYHFFMGFTSSVVVLALLVLPSLGWFFLEMSKGKSQSEESQPEVVRYAIICVAAVGGIAAMLLGGLWVYHLFLISQGKTTKEHLKGRKPIEGMEEEPTLCAPRGPQLFDQFALVDVEGFRKASAGEP